MKGTLRALWILAGLTALILMIATIGLAIRNIKVADIGTSAYLVSRMQLIHLHESPNIYSSEVAILESGTHVRIVKSEFTDNRTWYFIQADTGEGWVDSTYVSLTPP
jgi:hypothetical protein